MLKAWASAKKSTNKN